MSYRKHAPFGSVMLASLCSGPIFILTGVIYSYLTDPNNAPSAANVAGWLFIMPMAAAIGFVLSLLPNLIGTLTLHWLGQKNVGVRLPMVWVILGGVAAGTFAMMTEAGGLGAAWFATTGAMSAGICRRGAVWS